MATLAGGDTNKPLAQGELPGGHCGGADGGGKRPLRKNRPRPDRRLTVKQTEVMHVVGECKGNVSEAARQLGRDRKTVKQQYVAACKKLGATSGERAKVKSLPHDRRGQVDLTADRRK